MDGPSSRMKSQRRRLWLRYGMRSRRSRSPGVGHEHALELTFERHVLLGGLQQRLGGIQLRGLIAGFLQVAARELPWIRARQSLGSLGPFLFELGKLDLVNEIGVRDLTGVADRNLDRRQPLRIAHLRARGDLAIRDDLA